MKVVFAEDGTLLMDDIELLWPNFEGRAGTYNREGERSFNVIIDDQELADALINEGWNVKIRAPREDGESPFMYLPVKVKFGGKRDPIIRLQSGNSRVKLDEESVKCLDYIKFVKVDMDIRPYDWNFNGKTGRTAYLENAKVIQKVDRFADDWDDIDMNDEAPFDL